MIHGMFTVLEISSGGQPNTTKETAGAFLVVSINYQIISGYDPMLYDPGLCH